MSNASLRPLIDDFVAKLELEIRKAALEAVVASLGGAAKPAVSKPAVSKPAVSKPAVSKPAAKPAPKSKAPSTPKAPTKPAAKPSAKPDAKKRARRTPADLDRDVGRLVAYVRANNGSTNEKVRAALQFSKTEWSATLAKAIDTKQVVTKGEKRNTTLHLVSAK